MVQHIVKVLRKFNVSLKDEIWKVGVKVDVIFGTARGTNIYFLWFRSNVRGTFLYWMSCFV
jgi:hypothetical protein